jgi:hypothetical protein
VLRSAEEEDADRQAELFQAARSALASLEDRTAAEGNGRGRPSAAGSILLSLHRILRVADPGK